MTDRFCIRCRHDIVDIKKHMLCRYCYNLETKNREWLPSEVQWIDHDDYKNVDWLEANESIQNLVQNLWYDWDRKALIFICKQQFFDENKHGLKLFVHIHKEKPKFEIRDEYGNFITANHTFEGGMKKHG